MRWPATGNSSPKAADLPALKSWKEDARPPSPRPSPGRAAAEPSHGSDAGQDPDAVPGGGLDARYEQLRHAALHARAEAFPLGFAVLTRQGVIAWRRALADLAPTDVRPAPAATSAPAATQALPAPIAAELVNALAAVVLAAT